ENLSREREGHVSMLRQATVLHHHQYLERLIQSDEAVDGSWREIYHSAGCEVAALEARRRTYELGGAVAANHVVKLGAGEVDMRSTAALSVGRLAVIDLHVGQANAAWELDVVHGCLFTFSESSDMQELVWVCL